MKPRTTLAFAVVFLLALGTLGVLQYANAPTTEERERMQARVLPALDDAQPEHVTEVVLKRGDEELRFDHIETGDRWQMKKPLDVLADASAIRDIVYDLKNLQHKKLSGEFEESYGVFAVKDEGDLAKYKLDEPLKTLELAYKTREGKGPAYTVTLLVGDTAEGDQSLYVKLPEKDFVYVVSKTSLDSLDKTIAEFRERKLITTSRWNADRLALVWKERKLTAEKKDGKWHLTEPIQDRGNQTNIEEVIGKLTDLKVDDDEDFVDDAVSDLAKYGLDKPELVAEVRKEKSTFSSDEEDEDETPPLAEKLLIGKNVEGEEDKLYAKLEGQNYVVAIAASILSDVEKQPNDLRSRDLVDLTTSDVDYVSIQTDSDTVAMGKKGSDWEIFQPKEVRAENSEVTDLINKIDGLEIKEFIDSGEEKDYGLEEPAVEVALYEHALEEEADDEGDEGDGDDKEKQESKKAPQPSGTPTKVLIGNRDEETKVVYVKRGEGAGFFSVEDDGLWDLVHSSYLAYRRKQLLEFNESDVAQLTVYRDGKSYQVERKREKDDGSEREVWRMTEPVDAAADSGTVSDLLWDFSRLSAKQFIAEGVEDLGPYGLGEPVIRATATLKAEDDMKPEQHVLLVGREVEEDGGHYAKLGDGDLVFTIEQSLINYLREELHEHNVLKFDSDKVERLVLSYPDAKLELEYKKAEGEDEKEWTVANPKDFKLDAEKARDLVSYLNDLDATKFVQYEGDFKSEYGLEKPALGIEIKVEDGSDPKRLIVGAAAEDDHRYASTAEGSGSVFLLEQEDVTELLKGLGHFAAEEEKEEEQDKEKSPTEEKAEEKNN